MMRLADEVADRALAPSKVADAVLHALTAPRPRYLVGTEARVQLAMRKGTPDSRGRRSAAFA